MIDNKKTVTPDILFADTARFKAPNLAGVIITKSKSRKNKPTLHLSNIKQDENYYIVPINKETIDKSLKNNSSSFFVVENAYQLFQQPKKFVDFIVELREKTGYQKTIYTPSIGDPTNLALLAYMGIDYFDSISAILAARNDTFLFTNGRYNKNELRELPCSCPSCNKFKNKTADMRFKDILDHNYYTMSNEMKHVRNAIANGDLRGLVETRVKADPNLTAILKNLDANHYEFLENRTSITSKSKLLATTKESLYRPEIKRFQNRVIERYEKPESTKILLLLPCSAKKPYSFSKSHKFFKERLNASGNPFVVHELIITSPMGIVPRELELVHPASMYDIPVTGVWDEDEKKMIRKLLKEYLKNNKYDKIIAHLPKALMEFTEDILEKPEITCIDSPTSNKSLDKLSQVLKKNVSKYERVKPLERSIEDVQCLASYQFGKKIAEKLLKDCTIRGKYPYQKIIYKNTQLGMITKERGLISLTIEGAETLAESKKYWVRIYDDFTLKGSVFAPGVKDADKDIRIGDEVIVKRKDKLCAVGVAQMNGVGMKTSSHGEAVNVRHRA